MKNFTQKVKLEQRQELSEKNIPGSKQIRPQFLSNDTLLASLSQSSFPSSPYRPRSTFENFNPRVHFDEHKVSEISPRAHRGSLQGELKQHQKNMKPKTTMRRRSCWCEWCGGISSLEVKHKDVVLDEEPTQEEMKIDLDVSTVGKEAVGVRSRPSVDIQLTNEELVSHVVQDITPEAAMVISDTIKANNYKLLTINTTDPASQELVSETATRANNSPVQKSFLLANPSIDQSSLENYRVVRQQSKKKAEARLSEERDSQRNSLLLQRQGSFSPVKLRRDGGLSSIQAKKWELNKQDSVTIDLPAINSSISNMITSPKWVASPSNVMQKFCRDVSGYFPSSPQKLAKLSTPLSATFTEKIRMQNVKLESLKGYETREVPRENMTRGEFSSGSRGKFEDDEDNKNEDPLVIKYTGYKLKPRNRLASVGGKKETNLRSTKAKINSIYLDDKSNTSMYAKSMTKLKTATPLKRAITENQPLLLTSGNKTDVSKQSFIDYSTGEKEDLKQEMKSPRLKKLKKRKNTPGKQKDEHLQWLMQTFVPSKKNSTAAFPNIPQSLQNKITKKREDKQKFDQIEQIVASYAE